MTTTEQPVCSDFTKCMEHAEEVGDWFTSNLGEGISMVYQCSKCGRKWRDVYLFACCVDEETDEILREG